jgi:hypothetical protein
MSGLEQAFEALFETYDFVVEVRSYRLGSTEGEHWTKALALAIEEWCYVLGPEGVLQEKSYDRDERGTLIDRNRFKLTQMGSYRFFAPGEVVVPDRFVPLACPFVGPLQGFVAIKFDWNAWKDTVSNVVIALIKESVGRVFAVGPDAVHGEEQVFEVVCTKIGSFSLMLGKYSIDDGDVLLSRDEDTYVRYVIDAVKKALEREGYEGELGVTSTCHNPFRYWLAEDRFYIFGPNGSRPSQEELEDWLYDHSFEIWVFNFDDVERLAESVEVSVMWA